LAFHDSYAVVQSDWQCRTDVPDLTGQIHIWSIALRNSPPFQHWLYQSLSEREKSKVARVITAWKQDYQIQARGWLRWLLAQYTGLSPGDIAYQYGSLGKPKLACSNSTVQFNATDSGEVMLCAFSNSHELGIDVELTPRQVRHQRISEKKFTPHELQALSGRAPEQQSNTFLALWTRKEAYGKATGRGIRYPMNTVNLCEDFDTATYRFTDTENRSWRLVQFGFREYVACLASAENTARVRFFQLDIGAVARRDR